MGGGMGGGMGGEVRVRVEYRFRSLVKKKKREKFTLSFTSPEKAIFFMYL